jgi:DNA-binding NtrC family response regulator
MKRILVVDDDAASCKLLLDLFGAQGWSVETALTPEDALELAAQEKFDLLVSDINLEAKHSGIDLLRRLHDQCPVILVTGFGTLDTTVTASREGAWDIISKPFKVQELISTVRRALERETPRPEQAVSDALSAQYESAGLVGRSPAMLELYKEIARFRAVRAD